MAAITVVLMIWLSGCAGSASRESAGDSGATDSRRSSHSSGVAYLESPIRILHSAQTRVELSGDPRLGNATAVIGIVEFSDYQCFYCRDFHRKLFPKLKSEYVDTGVVQFVHKDFPLNIHPQAMPAATAARCAGAQGRYWEMHEALFANQGRLGSSLYPELARRMKLDVERFSGCFAETAREQEILRDLVQGRRLGVRGTPTFLIGKIEGNTLVVAHIARGAPDYESFAREIEKLRDR